MPTLQSSPLHIRTSPGEPEMERQAQKYLGNYYLDGPSERKIIALTFDDGPSQYTRDVLKILKEFDVKATFFLHWPEPRKTS